MSCILSTWWTAVTVSPEPPKYARLLCGGWLLSSEQINSALIHSLCHIQAEACVMHILKVYIGAFFTSLRPSWGHNIMALTLLLISLVDYNMLYSCEHTAIKNPWKHFMVFTCIMPANVTHLNDCLLEAIHYGSCMLKEHPFRVRRSNAVAFLNLST